MSLDQDRANAFLNRLMKALPPKGHKYPVRSVHESADPQTEQHQPGDRPFLQPHPTASPVRLQKARNAAYLQKKKVHENREDIPTQSRVAGYRTETLPPTRMDRLAATAVNEEIRATHGWRALQGNVLLPPSTPTTALPHVSGGLSNHAARARIANYVQVPPRLINRLEEDRSQGQDYHEGELRRRRNRDALKR